MNLEKLLFWRSPTPEPLATRTPPEEADRRVDYERGDSRNVFALEVANPRTAQTGLTHPSDKASPARSPHSGIFDAIEITEFFNRKHYGLGRQNGAVFRTQTALELGRNGIISEFQNVMYQQFERQKTKYQKLHLTSLETGGICNTTKAMLDHAKVSAQKNMELLQEQIGLAEKGRGWVLHALNAYQIGFAHGVREAIEFELI